MRILGIDPGTSTAFVVIEGDKVLHAQTIKRLDKAPLLVGKWAKECATLAKKLAKHYQVDIVGIEAFVPPSPYYGNKIQFLNPADTVCPSVVYGAVLGALFSDYPVYIVAPKHNGSLRAEFYPKCLKGRRPKDLPGSSQGTRQHEKSAFDVARKAKQSIKL